jgi:hypothetical protein
VRQDDTTRDVVANHQNPFTGVPLLDTFDCRQDTISGLHEVLAAEVAVLIRIFVGDGTLVRPPAFDLVPCQAGPSADVRLDQSCLDIQRNFLRVGDPSPAANALFRAESSDRGVLFDPSATSLSILLS